MQRVRTRRIIEINEELCDGCGACVSACSEGAIAIVDGKAKLVREDLCDGIGVCIGNCPKGAIEIKEVEHKLPESAPCGCPGAAVREVEASPLRNWPVQIRLVPPTAPFLRGADLLVVADCVPAACYSFHREFLGGDRDVVMIGCPKFDPYDEYVAKFAEIFKKNELNSLSVLIMEVPCCRSLVRVVDEARSVSGVDIPVRIFKIGVDGRISFEGEF